MSVEDWGHPHQIDREDNILGEEADIATCDNCEGEGEIDSGVVCEPCGGFFHRKYCWAAHWCGVLTDRNGRKVGIGTVLRHIGTDNWTYTVSEIPGTFLKQGACYGVRHKPAGQIHMIAPRITEVVN